MISLPITNPVLIFGLAAAIFLLAPLLAVRVGIPGMIGLILAGAVVGPNGVNLLARDATFVLFGTVGLLYLVFVAGAEIDLFGFERHRRTAAVFGGISYVIPQVIGIGVGFLLGYPLSAAILLGSMFGSHTLVAYPIASRLGITRLAPVTTAVGGTLVTDALAFLVLAVVVAAHVGEIGPAFWLRLGVSLAAFVAIITLLMPRLARWFFRREVGGAAGEYLFVLSMVFTGAFLAQAAGVQPIVGAFLVGLALNRLIPDQGPLINRIHFFGNAFFIPFFLVSIGMLVDLRTVAATPRIWLVATAMAATVTATKWLAARVGRGMFGYSKAEGRTMFGLTVPQAAATLAATLVGYQTGLFDDAVLNGAILMILVTCLLGPWTVERYGRQLALEEERRPHEPSEAPRRILVPISNPATADVLLGLALLVREPRSKEAIFPMTVVRPGGDRGTEAEVANAERLLGHAVHFASAAEVPVRPITRVDHNFADGITRAIEENRISTVILGWDGKRSGRHSIFGSVLDQLLEQTQQLVLVAKLGHPLTTTRRILLVIPAGSDHMPGFDEALRLTKLLAQRLNTRIHALVVKDDRQAYARAFAAIRPDIPATFQDVERWRRLMTTLREVARPDDLIVVLSGRRNSVAWHATLERLPGELAELLPESFIMVYPSAAEATRREELAGSAAYTARHRYRDA